METPESIPNSNKHLVAIFGGAVAGSEMAHQLTAQGIRCVVFDQNILPHGKIEDGLPKWHSKQRDTEEAEINKRLSHPLVQYVPQCKLGRDISFQEIMQWNFSAVILATGAWKDRPLPVQGIDEYVGKGLYYQNPFVYWYNHKHEPAFSGIHYDIADDAIIIGGGLASLDVAKILMIELVDAKLKERGIAHTLAEMNHGIHKILIRNNLTLQDLGIKGCTLYYRRRDMDMPLANQPVTTPEQLLKMQSTRQKILANFMNKFLFRFEPCMVPADKITESGKLKGIVFRKTEADEKKCVEIEGSETRVEAPLVISSIGSLPEHIEGLSTDKATFDIEDTDCCRVKGYENVFVIGNAVTGKGNINDSVIHAKKVAANLKERFFSAVAPLSDDVLADIAARTEQLQQLQGYDGKYPEWAARHTPVRLEKMGG